MSDSTAKSSNASNNNDKKKPSKQSHPAIGKGKGKGTASGAMIQCKTFVFKPKGNAIVNFAYNLMMDEEMMKEAGEAFEEREGGREGAWENGDETKTKEKESGGDDGLVVVDRKKTQTTTTLTSDRLNDLDVKAFVQRKSNLECITAEETSSKSTCKSTSLSVGHHNLKIFKDADGKKVYHFSPDVVIKTFTGPDGKLEFEETTPGAVAYIRNLKDFKVHLMRAEAEAEELEEREREVKGKEPEFSFRDDDAEEDDEETKVKSRAIDFSQFKRVRRS